MILDKYTTKSDCNILLTRCRRKYKIGYDFEIKNADNMTLEQAIDAVNRYRAKSQEQADHARKLNNKKATQRRVDEVNAMDNFLTTLRKEMRIDEHE